MSRLATHFYLDEFVESATATRHGIDNSPSHQIIINLTYTAIVMEQIRTLCGRNPVLISSGYRCPDLNKVIGGAIRSDHMLGMAVDFTIPGYGSVEKVVSTIETSVIQYDKLINEFDRWVHISVPRFSRQGERRALNAYRNSAGKVKYNRR